jgi:methionine sulfoxide reductase heme-binding subunit
MDAELISILLAIVITAVVAFPLGRQLRKKSVIFYIVAVVALAVYLWTVFAGINTNQYRWLTFMFQKAYLGSFFLALVMFCGALPDGNAVKRRLLPIRGELSIMSFIFYIGHIVTYLKSYLPMFANFGNLKPTLATSLVVAVILTVIFLVLGITSFKFIRSAMNSKVWRGIQKFAYLMVALLVVHVALALGLSLANLGSTGSIHVIVYVVLVAIYAVLRIYKAVGDKAKKAEKAAGEPAAE